MINSKQAANAPKAVTFQVQLERHLFSISVITKRKRFGRVSAATHLTLVTLGSGAIETGLNLSLGVLATRASHHAYAYNIVRFDLDSPI